MENSYISRIDKLKTVGLDESLTAHQITDDILDKLYDNITKTGEGSTNLEKQNFETVSQKDESKIGNDEKHSVTLEISNTWLTTIIKENIDKIIASNGIKTNNMESVNNITPKVKIDKTIRTKTRRNINFRKKSVNETSTINTKYPKVDKDDEKYIVTLKFLNELLTVLNKEKIDDITMFKNILRDDLLKPECNNVLENNISDLTKIFGKIRLQYRHRNTIKCYIISVIKTISKMCGYSFKSRNRSAIRKIDTTQFQTYNIASYSII